ncbi:ras association domain-containing protein 8-like [Trifolium pratense]|nr:ras association domain-containing protein 8-like [Trifolium pratense]
MIGGALGANIVEMPISCEDEDDVPLLPKFSLISSLGACSSKHDASVKKNTTVPAKRVLDNNNYSHSSVKKSKVEYYASSDLIKRPGKSTNDCFSLLMKDLELVENSYEECKMMTEGEEKRLQSIKRDIEECMKDFVVKEGQVYLMEELIEERKKEFKAKEIELHQVIDKDLGRKEEEVKALESEESQLVGRVEEFESIKKFEDQLKELVKEHEPKQKQCEDRVKELDSKQKQCDGRVVELVSKEKGYEGRLKELESREKKLGEQI